MIGHIQPPLLQIDNYRYHFERAEGQRQFIAGMWSAQRTQSLYTRIGGEFHSMSLHIG